jgi:DNA-binding transcriptional MerR regulator
LTLPLGHTLYYKIQEPEYFLPGVAMRISDVEAITGLSGKSIRLYEAKGLISTKRSDNSYRYFDDETVEKLKCIPVLRRVGISISDISALAK